MRTIICLLFLSLTIMISSPIAATPDALKTAPVITAKDTGNKIEVVKTFLASRADRGRAKIWVFFTDKEVFDNEGFRQKAASVTIPERALNRRAKMGLDHVTFGDLPVPSQYINAVTARDGRLRRVSRWLNAASFEVPIERIDDINRLPFVAGIRPVAIYTRKDEPEAVIDVGPREKSIPPSTLDLSDLDYGQSLGQLSQINVPAAHARGFNGSGVVVAMFDSGYRKDHEAFADAFGTKRVIAEYDFIFNDDNTQNEAEDRVDQHNHGTYCWSTLGGTVPGVLYGPAFGAAFILAKTEDLRSETVVEEDNWLAAVEWVEILGADVISSSLAYSDWYDYYDFDGETAVSTIAANLATYYGIVVCNAMANAGPASGTLHAPADAFEILSCGAVTSTGAIASFSSRGPTADGRIKPEVCAQGVSTYCATAGGTDTYGWVSGTSLSTPLIGGIAAVLLSARPNFTPQLVRQALMETADRADNPDNDYGWGIANIQAALDWGVGFQADVTSGAVPLTVTFQDNSELEAQSWVWSFGDGDSAFTANPTHTFDAPGAYTVSLSITWDGAELTAEKAHYIIALADTLSFASDTVYAGDQATVEVEVTNSQPLRSLLIPFTFTEGNTHLILNSYSVAGTRAEGYQVGKVAGNTTGDAVALAISNGGEPIQPGSGPVLRLFFDTDPYALGNWYVNIDTVTVNDRTLQLATADFGYVPVAYGGSVVIRDVQRGDANNDGTINVGDAVFLIRHVFLDGVAPRTIESGDANMDFQVNVADAVYLINYIFKQGPAPVEW